MLTRFRIIFSFIIIFAACACKQSGVRQIPISDFFKTPEESVFRLSPDGEYISYLKPYKGRQNLFVKSLVDTTERPATSFTDYSVREYSWTNNDQLVLIQDNISADEYKLYTLDVNTLQARNILSLEKGRIRLVSNMFEGDPNVITV